MLISRRFFLSREKMLSFLNELEETEDIADTLYIPSGLSLQEIEELLRTTLDPKAIPPELANLAGDSKTGAIVIWSPVQTILALPPFPITIKYLAQGYFVEPLRSLLKCDFKVALILVRLGAYAIGLYEGENIITSKVGTGLIHGRHKKGGSSQQRFRRHREKQIENFLNRVCAHIREYLEPHVQSLDYIVYGGARTTILLLQKQCPFLQNLDKPVLPPLLDITEPRQVVLEKVVGRLWSSRVFEWRNETLA